MRARVSLGRITRFIQDTEELDERARTFVDSPSAGSSTAINGDATDEAGIAIEADSIFRFSRYDDAAFTLTLTGDGGSTLRFPRGKTTIIAGDVGSGKSALLLALLGELHVVSGGVQLRSPHRDSVPKLSFAAQSPWLQDTSVRQNILFGEEYDDERYRETIFACALEDDLEALPEGDETRVGERGLSMSGCVPHSACTSARAERLRLPAGKSSASPSLEPSTPAATSSCLMMSFQPSTGMCATRRQCATHRQF